MAKEARQITKEERIEALAKVAKDSNLKKPIRVMRFKRQEIVKEEVISAYQSPLPSGVQVSYKTMRDGKYVIVQANRQVNKGDWVVIHDDGSQETFIDAEFRQIFEPYKAPAPPSAPSTQGRKPGE